MRRRIAILVAFILLAIPFNSIASNTSHHAVVIGINGGEARKVYEGLLKNGWSREEITLLMNENATYENICKALNFSASHVFFFYEGDGGRENDTNGDEGDGYDEGIITGDGKILTDDELREKFERMNATAISIFLDCDYGDGIGEDIPSHGKIIFFTSGILPFHYHLPSKILAFLLLHSQNSTYEKIFERVKTINNAALAFIPCAINYGMTSISILPIILSNLLLNALRSMVQFILFGIIDGIYPWIEFTFFVITLQLYKPFYKPFLFMANSISTLLLIATIESIIFLKNGEIFLPLSHLEDGYEGEMPVY